MLNRITHHNRAGSVVLAPGLCRLPRDPIQAMHEQIRGQPPHEQTAAQSQHTTPRTTQSFGLQQPEHQQHTIRLSTMLAKTGTTGTTALNRPSFVVPVQRPTQRRLLCSEFPTSCCNTAPSESPPTVVTAIKRSKAAQPTVHTATRKGEQGVTMGGVCWDHCTVPKGSHK